MESKKRLHSGSSDISDSHIDSLLGPEDSPIKPASKKSCVDEEQKNASKSPGHATEGRRSGSGSPTKSWLDSPSVIAEFSPSKTGSSIPAPLADYKPLVGSKFRIPKKVYKRCGECTVCKQSDCGYCDNCKTEKKSEGGLFQSTCSTKGTCEKSILVDIPKSPEKPFDNNVELTSSNNEKSKPKCECAGCTQVSPCGECFRCKKGKGGCDKMQCSVKQKENYKKYLEEKLKGTETGTGDKDEARKTSLANALAQLETKTVENLSDSEEKQKRVRKPTIEKLKKASESTNQVTVPKIEYQMSIAEKLKLKQLGAALKTQATLSSAQSTPGSSQPGSPKPSGRQALVPRCGICPGCLRTEKCEDCSSCLNKTGQCFRKRCIEKTKAANQRMKEKKKSMTMGYVRVSDSSDVESTSAIDSPISHSPINTGRCNECEGCTRTEDCGTCFKCAAGKKGCNKKQCFVRKREAENRSYQNRKLAKKLPMQVCGDCEGCKASNCNNCENCTQILAGNITLTCTHKHCSFMPVKQVSSTPKANNKKCGTCEGCLADFCKECGYCLSGNEKVMILCMKRRCKNVQPSGKRRIRCYECAGCKQEDCGECHICVKKANGEKTNSFCTKRKCVNFNETTPAKKAKRTRCGECIGCNSGPCGDCVICQKGHPQLCRAKHCKNPIKSENETPKGPKMKRIRCGECTGCMSDPCGLCSICQKAPQLCKTKRCTNATMREVVKREKIPRTPGSGKSKSTWVKGSNPRRFKRCGDCKGCKMPDCGVCASCKMNEQFGEEMVLGKAACLELVCQDPIDLYMTRLDGGEGSGYYEKQCFCEGCTKEECGECENCKGDPKFGGTDDPVKLCILKECQKRTRTKQKNTPKSKKGPGPTMLKLMAEQEDGTCPTRVINGILYDFRCYFCKKLPRVGSANRSELYRHYAVYHYAAEIKAEFGNMTKCPHCSVDIKGSYVSHMGQKHNEVDKYLPESARIPISVQGKGGGGNRHRRGAVIVRKRQLNWIWPDIPEGFDPNGEDRLITLEEDVENEEDKLIIDGFEIENNYDEDEEPLLVSRDEPVSIPDHSGKGALCMACKSSFSDILPAVLHIHDIHNIKGGSSNILLDTDRLMKCGYIKLTDGVTQTVITEAGTKQINPVPQMAEQGDVQKKPTARKSTTTSPRDKPSVPAQPSNTIIQIDKESRPTVIPDSIVVTKVPAKPSIVAHILSADEESALRKSKIMEAIRINKMALTSPSKDMAVATIDLA
eukprot:TRINITY_DN14623_c0_g1_i1.p1 TRINITY_DN14623_c0_g1~~TRINITY_DN14623_c0_g1_i1.p1  ORF type:complete len:1245 (-),score=218.85 TRINITY_DN14623_c0_g1_i1:73-3807(-)